MKRRLIPVAIVTSAALGAFAIASDGGSDGLTVPSDPLVLHTQVGTVASMTLFLLANHGTTPVTVTGANPNCTDFDLTFPPATVPGGSDYTVSGNSTLSVPKIETCDYALTPAGAASFTALAVYDGGQRFTSSTSSTVNFGSASAASPQSASFTVSHTATTLSPTIYAYVTDSAGSNYKISACPGGTLQHGQMGCLIAGASKIFTETIGVTCAPTGMTVPPDQHLYIVSDDAPGTYADFTLECTSNVLPPGVFSTFPYPTQTFTATVGGSGSADVTLQNMGSSNLTVTSGALGGTDPGDFTLMWGSNCPGSTCVIGAASSITLPIVFHPTGLAGTRDATLTFMHTGSGSDPYTINLNGTATNATTNDPVIGVTSPIIFHEPIVQNESRMIPITNGGSNSTLTITGISQPLNPQFEITFPYGCAPSDAPCMVTSGGSANIDVTYMPSAVGTSAASTFTITSNDPTNPTLTVDVQGSTDLRQLRIDSGQAETFDLGSHPVGVQSAPQTFTLYNTGTVDADVINIHAMANSGIYMFDPTNLSLAAGDHMLISVKCTPTGMQDYADGLEIVGSGSGGPIPVTTMPGLECQGTSSQLDMSPSVAFGEVRVGDVVAAKPVTLSTIGPALTLQTGPAIAGGTTALGVTNVSGSMITMAAPVTFDVTLDTSAENLAIDDKVVATTTDGSMASVRATGSVTTPAITAPPASISLGTYCIGETPASRTASLTASGTSTITIGKPTLAMGSAFELDYTSPNAGSYTPLYPLAANATASVDVRAVPQTVAGTVMDAIDWTTDMPASSNQQTLTTNLTATWLADGGGISPGELDFQGVAVHGTTPAQTVTLQNCGTTPLALGGPPTITPAGAFHDVSQTPLPATLGPTETATIDIVFAPVKPGNTAAQLAVPGVTTTVALMGHADGGGDVERDDRGFYACGCRSADPGTGGAIGLALVGMFARRRRRRAAAAA